MEPNCDCDDPHVVFVRKATASGGKETKYYQCLSCGSNFATTERTSAGPEGGELEQA